MLSMFDKLTRKKKFLFSGNMGGNNNPYTPSLYFPFALKSSLTAQAPDNLSLTFTRASSQTYFDSTGTLQTATTNVAAFDYNPTTLVPLGLSMWEARTNSIRNNTMVGAVAGTPGTLPTNWVVANARGLTINVTGTGTEKGIPYIDIQYVGTPSSSGAVTISTESDTQIAALQNQSWTASIYPKFQAGSLTNVTNAGFAIKEINAGGSLIASGATTYTPTAGTLGSVRQTATYLLPDATAAFVNLRLDLTVTSGAAVDFTLRIGMPQLELGAFATPAILTTAAAATRAAPVCSTTNLGWYNATEGTLLVSQSYATGSLTASPTEGQVVRIWDGSGSNIMSLRFVTDLTAPQLDSVGIVSGVSQWDTAGYTSLTPNTTVKSALAYAANNVAQVTNGGTAQEDTSCSIPVVDRLTFLLFRGGWIASLTYYPLRLPNATLQSLST